MAVTGLKDAVAALDGVEKALKKKLLRKASVAGAKVVVAGTRARLKKRSGLLSRSIGTRTKAYKDTVATVVGAREGMAGEYRGRKEDPANIAHLVELGTRPHSLAKGSKLKRVRKDGSVRNADVGQGVGRMHPGARPHPALIPAKTTNAGRINRLMTDILLDGIDAAAKGGAG